MCCAKFLRNLLLRLLDGVFSCIVETRLYAVAALCSSSNLNCGGVLVTLLLVPLKNLGNRLLPMYVLYLFSGIFAILSM